MFQPFRFIEGLKPKPAHGSRPENRARISHASSAGHAEAKKAAAAAAHAGATEVAVAAVAEATEARPAHHHAHTETTEVTAAAVAQVQTPEGSATVAEVQTMEVTSKLGSVHATVEGVESIELTPPHPPREDTPEYVKTHHHLTIVLDSPCAICGVRNSTLKDHNHNVFGSKALETHHYPIERSLLDACDPRKISVVFPQVKDQASLEAFVDSEGNMMVLCDVHHRHPMFGIHHLAVQDFFIQSFLLDGYQVVADQADEAAILARDEAIEKAHGR